MKKILTFICAFTLVFLSFGSYQPKKAYISASAYNETYNYTASVDSSYNSIDSYAIDSVESFNVEQGEVIKLSFTTTVGDLAFLYFSGLYGFGNVFSQTSMYFNARDNTSIMLIAKTGTFYFAPYSAGGYIALGKGSFDLYFCYNVDCSVNGSTPIFQPKLYDYIGGYTSIVDMVADTNFSIGFNSLGYFEQILPNSFYTEVLKMSFNQQVPRTFSTSYESTGNVVFGSRSFNSSFYMCNFSTLNNYVDSSTVNNNYGYNLYFVYDTIVVNVYRPVYRVNNTLILYIYDYLSLPQYINSLSYSLSRNNDLYYVHYNGVVPNNYFDYFYNNDIQNTLFDEYITVTFDFNVSQLIPIHIDNNDFSYYLPCGFDFNFTYYAEPLNSSNGIYSYTFQKPGYVAMEFSLSPFYIPVLEMVENALIFLIFYCPIISDILDLLHMSEFLGGLITVLNYYTTGVLGSFLTALISFFIFYSLFKMLMPRAISSGVSVGREALDNSQMVYNARRNKQDKKLAKEQQKEVRYTQALIKHEERKRKRK